MFLGARQDHSESVELIQSAQGAKVNVAAEVVICRLREKLFGLLQLVFASPSNSHRNRKYLRGNSTALR